MNAYIFVCSEKLHKIFFIQRRKDRCRQCRLDFAATFIGSRDICCQTQKLS